MKKSIGILGIIGVMAMATGLTACGSGKEDGLKIDFWHTFGQGIETVLNKQIKNFEKLILDNEGVKVHIQLSKQGSYDDIKAKIDKGFSAGNIPTISVAYPDHVANYLNAEKYDEQYVVNLQKLIDDPYVGLGVEGKPHKDKDGNDVKGWLKGDTVGVDDFIQEFYKEGTEYAKPGVYSLPYLKSSEVLFYNEQAVQRAFQLRDGNDVGFEEKLKAMNWDEFMEFNEFILKNKNVILSTMEFPLFYDSDANLFVTKMYQNEIPYASVNASNHRGKVLFDEGPALESAKTMVRKLKTSYDKGLFSTKGILNKYGSDSFTNGKCVFTIGSTGGTGYVSPKGDSFKLGVIKAPCDNNNPKYVSQGPCLTILKNPSHSSSLTEQKVKYAWKFVKYILTAENNATTCVVGSEGYIPCRTSAQATQQFEDLMMYGENFAKAASVLLTEVRGNYISTPVFPGSAELRDAVGSIITQTLVIDKNSDKIDEKIATIFNKTISEVKTNL